MWILNVCAFGSTSENGTLISCFKKMNLKIGKYFNTFVFFIFMKNTPFLNDLPFFVTPPFSRKIFHPTLIAKFEELIPPL